LKYSGANIITPFQIGVLVGTIENDVPVYDSVSGTESTVLTDGVTILHRYRLKSFGDKLFNAADITPANDPALQAYFDSLLAGI